MVAVLADLPGPKVRAGRFEGDGVHVTVGLHVKLVPGNDNSTAETIHVDYPSLLEDLAVGDVFRRIAVANPRALYER